MSLCKQMSFVTDTSLIEERPFGCLSTMAGFFDGKKSYLKEKQPTR